MVNQASPFKSADRIYSRRTPEYYLNRLKPEIFDSLDNHQIEDIKRILAEAMPQPSPKLVDLRFTIDLLVSKFYLVLLLGKDRRRQTPKRRLPNRLTRIGNAMTAIILLLSLNFLISAGVFLVAYLLKSAVGINLFPGHISDTLEQLQNR
ncbi:MAG: hypothetical protein HC886_14765 [Leptolyngbyaceae cyanobacterium SM1_1_3]|nr:hypothetical protein [Leptolyngbyaceae cyanobacterium SM1_1_3]NJN02295.1 hypothetical protein [Leptolyngbyaceae cyanobacterium RM1_1_2]NJO11496.1 hypothetical protein [Leptolyngbyaceae cyanobacterium SL_1_1]